VCCSLLQCVAVCCSLLQCRTGCNARPSQPFLTRGWRRCTGCLKLQVSFRQRATNYRALLRKTTYKDKAHWMQRSAFPAFARFRCSMCSVSCRCRSAKEPLIIGLFCGNQPIKIRHTFIARPSQPCRVCAPPCNLLAPQCPVCVLQCVAVCCSALQCAAACCSALQCIAVILQCSCPVCCSVLLCVAECCSGLQLVAVICQLRRVGARVAKCCSVLQCVAVCCSVLQCVAVCCSVLQCVAVCCSVLQ